MNALLDSSSNKPPEDIYRHIKLCGCTGCTDSASSLTSEQSNASGLKRPELPTPRDAASLNFVPRVSFNTVPSVEGTSLGEGDDEDDDYGLDYTEEEYYDTETNYWDRNRDYVVRNSLSVPTSRIRGSSPPPSLLRKLPSIDGTLSDKIYIGEHGRIIRSDYPSRPTVVNDALVINRAHRDYEKLWQQRKLQIDQRRASSADYFKFPEILFPKQKVDIPAGEDDYTPLTKEQKKKCRIINERVGFPNTARTVLCHISGRRHTWVSLDWLLRSFVRDLDHIVVIANLPRMSRRNRSRSRSRSRSVARRSKSVGPTELRNSRGQLMHRTMSAGQGVDENEVQHQTFVEWSSGYEVQRIRETLNNILEYVTFLLPPQKAIKVTVEIVVGKTKRVLIDAMNVYSPDLTISSSLRWKDADNLVVWKSKNLTDKLSQEFPIPVIIVPVKRMNHFEKKLQQEFSTGQPASSVSGSSLSPKQTKEKLKATATTLPTKVGGGSDSSSTPGTESSVSSIYSDHESDYSDDSSLSSIELPEDLKAQLRKKLDHHRKVMDKRLKTVDEDSKLGSSDRIYSKVDVILEASLNCSIDLDNLTGSTDSFSELKRVITGDSSSSSKPRKSMLDVVDVPLQNRKKLPQINVAPSLPQSPSAQRSSQIKFAPEVKGRDGKSGLGISKLHRVRSCDTPASRPETNAMFQLRPDSSQKYERAIQNDNGLRKVRSANSIKPTKSIDSNLSYNSDTSTKRKSGFFSFFKGSGGSSSNSGVSSRSSSRRNSSGSESSAGGVLSGGPTKKKTGFLRFKKK